MVSAPVVLVTGGSGFIGSHVVDALVDAGARVRVLDALIPAAHGAPPWYGNPSADYANADLTDHDAVRRAVEGIDAVSHQASLVGLERDIRDAPAYVRNNDLGTAELLGALADAGFDGRFVLASSMVVYGEGSYRCVTHGSVRPGSRDRDRLASGRFDPPCPACGADLVPEPVNEDATPDPRSVYAATKLHQEHLVACFARERGSVATALRYHNVYGERMPRDTPYAGVASIFRSSLEAGRAPEIFEDGGQIRDFVHARDVARANVSALLGPPATGAINIASGAPRTIREMADAMCTSFGSKNAAVVTGRFRPGDVRHVFASADRARTVLGFEATTPFREGVAGFARSRLREPSALRTGANPDNG
jgi:dTDP-L-rhamnose 4-epimerase